MKSKILKILGTFAVSVLVFQTFASQVVDVYSLSISLRVPQVVDNSRSLGKRIYQKQKITGNLLVYYDDESGVASSVELDSLVNKTFKIGGSPVKYKSVESYLGISQIWNAIGSNKTGIFGKSSVCLNATLEPSYALSQANNDNSLVLVFAGTSTLATQKLSCGTKYKFLKSVSGYVVGTQGCGCHDYGHTSPTRVIGLYGPTDQVIDVASVFGTWKAKFSYRTTK